MPVPAPQSGRIRFQDIYLRISAESFLPGEAAPLLVAVGVKAVASIEYDPATQGFDVESTNGRTYWVPREVVSNGHRLRAAAKATPPVLKLVPKPKRSHRRKPRPAEGSK